MASTNVSVPISRYTKDLKMTLTIKGLRVMRVRMWVGAQIVKFAAMVMGIGHFEVVLEKK